MSQAQCVYCKSFDVKSFGRRYVRQLRKAKYYLFCRDCGQPFSIEEGKQKTIKTNKKKKKTYPQEWPEYNKSQENEKILFIQILQELLQQVPEQKMCRVGRPKQSLRDMLFCCTLKTYLRLPSRRLISDLKIAQQQDQIFSVPHFNTILKYFNTLELKPPLEKLIVMAALPLRCIENNDFAVDSTGFSTSQFGRWLDERWGKERKRRKWVKCHAMIGTKTNIVTSFQITSVRGADISQLPQLVKDTNGNFTVKELSADKAYLSHKALQLIDELGIKPFIMFKENSEGKISEKNIWNKMFSMFWLEKEKYLKHYHRRSNVETSFGMIKAKFGGLLRSKFFVGQENEILTKLLCHNICCLIQEMYVTGIQNKIVSAH